MIHLFKLQINYPPTPHPNSHTHTHYTPHHTQLQEPIPEEDMRAVVCCWWYAVGGMLVVVLAIFTDRS